MAGEYKVVMKETVSGTTQFRNIFYFAQSVGATPTPADWATIAGEIADKIKGVISNAAAIDGYEVWELIDEQWLPVASGTLALAGLVTGDALPFQTAAVVLGRTNTKRTMGRKFLGPISEGSQNAGVLSGSALTALNAFCTWYSGNVTIPSGGTLYPRTWSKLKGFHAIVSSFCSYYLGSQRRRKPGVGV